MTAASHSSEGGASGGPRRILSDVPVQRDVWRAYARSGKEDARLCLLLQPNDDVPSASAVAATAVRHALLQIEGESQANNAGIIHIPGLLQVNATLAELIFSLLPLTNWWADHGNEPEAQQLLYRHLIDNQLPIKEVPAPPDGRPVLNRIALDRNFDLASLGREPLITIKADAARRLFDMDCSRLCWAIIDGGIQGRLDAFKDTGGNTRVIAAYDFASFGTWLRRLSGRNDIAFEVVQEIEETFKRRDPSIDGDTAYQRAVAIARALHDRLRAGGEIDWDLLEPILNIDPGHELPRFAGAPLGHGTAVAGLLAGSDENNTGLIGVCPDLRLIDIRVAAVAAEAAHERLEISEFNLVAALQFLRYLNRRSDHMMVHGVNMSVETPHDVRNYACGATLICEEVDRAVQNGMVVVVAAGNNGHRVLTDAAGNTAAHYFGMTIADPGNAELAITVGSTHRRDPHRYGVSYFSGRGPTGDGRCKPDLIAPGEKLDTLTATGGIAQRQDGTSFAAPLVSGAAAMLMARYPEFTGRPQRVKDVLKHTATDLGRDRNFQGAGLLNTLRALQHV